LLEIHNIFYNTPFGENYKQSEKIIYVKYPKVLEIETVSLRMSLVFFKMAFLCGQ